MLITPREYLSNIGRKLQLAAKQCLFAYILIFPHLLKFIERNHDGPVEPI